MVNERELTERTKGRPSIDELTTVIWTREMGRRLALVRMKRLMDQREMARALGLERNGQGTVSRIELGRLPVTERLTVATLKKTFHTEFMFIVFGSNPERFNAGVIVRKYWDTRLRVRRKNRSQSPFRSGRSRH